MIYMDTNVYCRPFDIQTQPRIAAETAAFLEIIDSIEYGQLECLSSTILNLEVRRIRDETKRYLVASYAARCMHYVKETEQVKELAKELVAGCGLRNRDALHIASAAIGGAQWFLTCDDGIMKKGTVIERLLTTKRYMLKVLLPTTFISSRGETIHNG